MRELPNVADLPKTVVPIMRTAILQRRIAEFDREFLEACGIVADFAVNNQSKGE